MNMTNLSSQNKRISLDLKVEAVEAITTLDMKKNPHVLGAMGEPSYDKLTELKPRFSSFYFETVKLK